MKLLRYGPKGKEKPGMLDASGAIRDLSRAVKDIGGDALTPAGLKKLKKLKPEKLKKVSGKPRLGQAVNPIGKFICVGLNYADHAAETGSPIPAEPVLFLKTSNAFSLATYRALLPITTASSTSQSVFTDPCGSTT